MAGRNRRTTRNGIHGSGTSGVEPEATAPNPELAALYQLLQQQAQTQERLLQQQVQTQERMQQLEDLLRDRVRAREPQPAPPPPPPPVADIPPVVDLPPPPHHFPPVDHLLDQFLKLRAPTFSGAVGEDPTAFLEEMNKRFRIMRYLGDRRVELVEFVLEGRAQLWYNNLRRSRPVGVAPLSWEEFQPLFMEEFLPESVRMSRALEFEQLRHVRCSSVDEYASRFLELSEYAPGLVGTERQKINRFVYGLRKDVRKVMVGQTHGTLTETIDKARRIELWDAEDGSSDMGDQRKKFRVDTPQMGQRGAQIQRPQIQPQVQRGVQIQRPIERGPGTCFHCHRPGHIRTYCPLLQGGVQAVAPPAAPRPQFRPAPQPGFQQGQMGRGGGGPARGIPAPRQTAAGRGQARLFALQPHDLEEVDHDVVAGMVSICSVDARVLFDSGATHSFVSSQLAGRLGRLESRLETPLVVANPIGRSVEVSRVFRECDVRIEGFSLPADLVLLEMLGFDSILGMDWLARHHATLDCRGKRVVFNLPDVPGLVFQGDRSTPRLNLISCLRAQRVIRKGGEAYLAHIREVSQEEDPGRVELDSIRVVRDFPDVFPDDLPDLPPEREVDFAIDLVPDTAPISKAPYRMAPAELKELKDQLQDLLDKGFIRPSVSPWGAPVLFVKKKDGSMRLCIDYRELNKVPKFCATDSFTILFNTLSSLGAIKLSVAGDYPQ